MPERDEPLDVVEPPRLSRRAFVKGCLYASAAGVAAVGAGATLAPLAMVSRAPFKRVEYIGSTLIAGPAPQGIPLMPLAADKDGSLRVNPKPEGVEGGVLDWYKYCGHEATPGLQAGFRPKDEFVRFFLTEEKKHTIVEGWYLDRLGEVCNVEDFERVGMGAGFNWRSQGQTGKNIITGILIKIDPKELEFTNAPEELVREQFLVPTDDGAALVAFCSFCKHFCCVPGWHESNLAREQGVWDKMFCTCHFSVYDPYLIKGDFYMLQTEEAAEEASLNA